MKVAIGLGSNIGDREASLAAGRDALATGGLIWQALSSLYETEPVGPIADQGAFLNQAGIGETAASPRALLSMCLAAEQAQGRVRAVRWGPRTLDLDVLLYSDALIDEPDLIVPHPEMARRAFVLVPLDEIAPEWVVPGTGKTVRELCRGVDGREGVTIWQSTGTKRRT